MSLPIVINATVSESEQKVNMTVSEIAIELPSEISTQIVADVGERYEGSYSVTPSEEAQTLETNGKEMTDDVSVEAIPSSYVGSGVRRMDSSDMSASGDTVTAPAGYYASPASKSVQGGSVIVGDSTITIDNPTVTVNQNGVVSVSGEKSEVITPTVESGYVSSGAGGNIKAKVVGSYPLNVQAGKTVAPIESEQVAVTSGKYTTGEVKVGAIPDSYVGSGVARNDSTSLNVSGDTVNVPAGYFESNATASVQSAAWKQSSTVGVVPEISIDANGLITANCAGWTSCHPLTESGYANADTAANIQLAGIKTLQLETLGETEYTPTKAGPQIITSGKYLTGNQTIKAIPASWYDMSGDLAWLGADATLVKEITLTDVKLANTAFASWTPSTTATDILATRTAGTFTASDMPDYDYYICWDTVMPIEYQAGAVDKARGIYLAAYHVQAIIRRASIYADYQAGLTNNNINVSAFMGSNFYRYYSSTQGRITYVNSTSYGFYGTVTANTISSTTADSPTITLETPKVTARCSTTYLSASNAALIDQDKTVIKQKCRVYRVKKPSFMQGVWLEVMRLVQEVDQ